jgi:hypothetical protein
VKLVVDKFPVCGTHHATNSIVASELAAVSGGEPLFVSVKRGVASVTTRNAPAGATGAPGCVGVALKLPRPWGVSVNIVG